MRLKLIVISLFYVFLCQNLEANYRVGDIILLDLDCWSCQRIEDETFGPYSHSGIIVESAGVLVVAQSLSTVHHVEIESFLKFSNKKSLHLRPKKLNLKKRQRLSQNYQNEFFGRKFDHDFLWDDSSLYCSEFLYKLLDSVGAVEDLRPMPMNFERNWEFWNLYFHKTPPQDEIGLSPNDFFRSSDFHNLGEI